MIFVAERCTGLGRRNVRTNAKKEKLMWEALREAHDEEMERDPTVLVIGEDSYIVKLPDQCASRSVLL